MPTRLHCIACGQTWSDETSVGPVSCPHCGQAAEAAAPWLERMLERLEKIEGRLARLEAGREPVLQAQLVPPHSPSPALPPEAPRAQPPSAAAARPRPTLQELWREQPPKASGEAAAQTAAAAEAPPPAAAASAVLAAKPAKAAKEEAGLERKIGLQWAAWIGAVVLFLGVGLGLKYALDQGWLRFLTPLVRMVLMSLGGLSLIAAGEYVFRRANPLSAVGLFGAGIGVLFFVGFAGSLFFELYSANVAFAFTAATALIGSGVAFRSRFVAVGVLAQLGGNLAPILLSTGQRPELPFFGYLYLLQAFALLLCWWGAEPKWWALRLLSLATTFLWILASQVSRGAPLGLQDELLWFTLLASATFHAEFVRSALQYEIVGAGAAGPLRRLQQAGGTYLLAVTLAGALVGLKLLAPETANLRGLFLAGLAATAAIVGFLLWRTELRAPRALAWAYGLQTIVLTILIVPVCLDGPWISIGWALLACAFAAWGSCQAYGPARWAAAGTWLLAVASLGWAVDAEAQPQRLRDAWLSLWEAPLPGWLLIAWLEALGGLFIAWLLQTTKLNRLEPPGKRTLKLARLLVWSACLLAVATGAASLPALGTTATALISAGALWLMAPLAKRLRFSLVALVLFLFAVGKWLTWDALHEVRLLDADPRWRWLVVNRFLALGAVLGIGFAAFLWRQQRRWRALFFRRAKLRNAGTGTTGLLTVVLLLFAMLTVGLSVETHRLLLRLHADGWANPWPGGQELALALVVLWSALGALLGETLRRLKLPEQPAWLALGAAAAVWLLFGALVPFLEDSVATVPLLLNLQCFSALALAAAVWRLGRQTTLAAPQAAWPRTVQQLLALVLLAAGTLEVDRAVPATANPAMPHLAQQAGISVWWSLFAVAAVAFGFWRRLAWLRYFGLGLFAFTLAKVGLVDLQGVSYGYRVISLIVLGLLLIGTSVLYGFLSPRLLERAPRADAASSDSEGPRN